MQALEMRTFYTPKHIINLSLIHKSLSHTSLISFQSLRNSNFLRCNRCDYNRRHYGERSSTGAERKQRSGPGNGNTSSDARRVFTEYDSLTGRVVVSRKGHVNCRSEEPGSDYGDDGGRTYLDEGERIYRNARKEKSVGGSGGRPNFDRRAEGFAARERDFEGERIYRNAGKEKSGGGSGGRPNFDRQAEGFGARERGFGGVQKEGSVDGLDRRFGADYSVKNAKKGKRQSFWVCLNCGKREGQKWESCRACKSTGTMNYASNKDGGDSGNKRSGFGVSGNRFNSYGSTEKANVLGGSGSDFSKGVNNLSMESFSQDLSTEELKGNEKSVNDTGELQVLDNSVFSSFRQQAGKVHPQPMMMKQVTGWTSKSVSVDDFIGGRTSESVQTGDNIAGNKSSGFEVSMKQELQPASEDETPMDLVGNRINDMGRDEPCESVKRENWVEGSVNQLNYDKSDTGELQVLDNSVFPSFQQQAGKVHPQPMMMKQVTRWTSKSVPVDDFIGGRTGESVQTGDNIAGNKSSGFEVSMKQELQPASEDEAPMGLVGNRINDMGRDEPCESVKRESWVGGSVNQLNYDKGVEGISGESAASIVENDSLTHGLGQVSTSEAVTVDRTRGLEVSGNAMHSRHSKQVSDALPSPLTVKQELELTSQNEIQMGLSSSGNKINSLDTGGTEGSVKKSKLVCGSVNSSDSNKEVKDSSKERAFRVVEQGSSTHGFGQGFNVGDIVTKKKKSKSAWVCSNCGHTEGQWWGSCKGCNSVGTMKRFSVGDYGGNGDETSGSGDSESAVRSWLPKRADKVLPMRLRDVNRGINKLEWRIPLSGSFGSEVARVLGGGLVPGSLVLVGGDPGIGKSTLLLQLAAIIAEGNDIREPGPVVYVSGEESVEQIGNRADRMKIGSEELFLYSGTDIEDILERTHLLSPRLLIVDSIQTVYLKDVTGSAGGISQVKECTSALLRYAKKTNVPVLLIGHVTKSGDIAGPRVLEHIVDVVLYLEGEKYTSHRLLRSIKNRFGSTDELGIFEMSQSGLLPVSNPSEMYLTEEQSDSEFLAGLAVAVIMDGTRSFLIEIQALCVAGSRASRHFNGVQESRADMIISVLMKQAGLMIQENAIFLNVVSGVKLPETAGDLAIAAAICSSFLEVPIPPGVAFIGEIGLSGELRGVPRMDVRINTVAQLGYKKCIVPKSALKSLKGLDHKDMEIIGCSNLKNVINTIFTTPVSAP